MAHPPRFTEDDPLLARVRSLCLRWPAAKEKVSHGRPTFYTTKVFAYFGGNIKGDHHSERHNRSLLVLPDPDERLALLQDERCYDPAYLGPSGWIGFFLDDDTDWAEVAELVDSSYRNTAPVRLVRELDRGPSPVGSAGNREH